MLDTKEQSVRVKSYFERSSVWKLSLFETENERGEHGFINLCIRYEGMNC